MNERRRGNVNAAQHEMRKMRLEAEKVRAFYRGKIEREKAVKMKKKSREFDARICGIYSIRLIRHSFHFEVERHRVMR